VFNLITWFIFWQQRQSFPLSTIFALPTHTVSKQALTFVGVVHSIPFFHLHNGQAF
jgi:hypothetical protein